MDSKKCSHCGKIITNLQISWKTKILCETCFQRLILHHPFFESFHRPFLRF